MSTTTTIKEQNPVKKPVKKEKPTCQICDENVNESSRKLIDCPYCSFSACRRCCETYLLNESIVKCMNNDCNREWARQHMTEKFTKTFINNALKKHKEQVLFEQETALLPSTQPLVEQMIEKEKIISRICKINKTIFDLRNKKRELEIQLSNSYRINQINNQKQRAEFIMSCPDSECRGFLSTQWKCGLCTKWTCPDCHIIKGDHRDSQHTCNPYDLATAQLLQSDTKPCPKCRFGIFKIEGCNEMFCTQCNTSFNWLTGRIQEAGHNPHYFEWLRRNSDSTNHPRIDNCNNEHLSYQHYITIRNLLHGSNPQSKIIINFLEKIIRNTIHTRYEIQHIDAERFHIERNQELRIRYMRNKITEDEFKVLLQRNDKKCKKTIEMNHVYEILVNTITDIILRFITNVRSSKSGCYNKEILYEIETIIDYVNECIVDISHTYSSKLKQFTYELVYLDSLGDNPKITTMF